MRLSARLVVTGSADKAIKIWNRRDATWTQALYHLWTLTGHSAFVSTLYLCGDNNNNNTLLSSSPGDCSVKT